ncbi:MAG: universal stress protein [Thermodesulfobacteriota bacterium]
MFKKILVPIDVDRPIAAKAVYDCAAEIAAPYGSEIKLVSVMPGFGMPIVGSFISDRVRQEALDSFREALTTFTKENCSDIVTFHIRSGKHYEEIVKMAKKWEADLIVVYHNRRREINEVFSHTCAKHVYRDAPCSVLRLRNIREE